MIIFLPITGRTLCSELSAGGPDHRGSRKRIKPPAVFLPLDLCVFTLCFGGCGLTPSLCCSHRVKRRRIAPTSRPVRGEFISSALLDFPDLC